MRGENFDEGAGEQIVISFSYDFPRHVDRLGASLSDLFSLPSRPVAYVAIIVTALLHPFYSFSTLN